MIELHPPKAAYDHEPAFDAAKEHAETWISRVAELRRTRGKTLDQVIADEDAYRGIARRLGMPLGEELRLSMRWGDVVVVRCNGGAPTEPSRRKLHYADDMCEVTSWSGHGALPSIVQLAVDCSCNGAAHLLAPRARAVGSGLIAAADRIDPPMANSVQTGTAACKTCGHEHATPCHSSVCWCRVSDSIVLPAPAPTSMEIIEASPMGCRLMMRSADTRMFVAGSKVLVRACSVDGHYRSGSATVAWTGRTEHGAGVVELSNAIPATCAGDFLELAAIAEDITEDRDHTALVAYLLSAVRRKDWHAVSDAANDLRVLEASRR